MRGRIKLVIIEKKNVKLALFPIDGFLHGEPIKTSKIVITD